MFTDLVLFFLAVALALFLRVFVLEFSVVRGSSMLSTLHNGNVMFVSILTYHLRLPQRQEIVICHYPHRRMKHVPFLKQQFVKRVIGLPGETIEIVEGIVHINGEPLPEPYLNPAHNQRLRTYPPVVLGEHQYFVIGDNRDNSNDSRAIGPLDQHMIVGHVCFLIHPLKALRFPKLPVDDMQANG